MAGHLNHVQVIFLSLAVSIGKWFLEAARMIWVLSLH